MNGEPLFKTDLKSASNASGAEFEVRQASEFAHAER